ncbi:MAG: cellulose binding domain-containing protein, partial [Lachnospiraceae bacterium]|nr:cellulose binding domain-containing protein [Lachnospiraceae bacterium]
ISINSTVNSWDNGFTINMVLKNETDSDINGWSLKIKKSDLTLTQCWNAEMTEDGDYIILKSEDWNSTIPAGGTISIGGVGTGTAKSDFEYEIIK